MTATEYQREYQYVLGQSVRDLSRRMESADTPEEFLDAWRAVQDRLEYGRSEVLDAYAGRAVIDLEEDEGWPTTEK